jgi:uncharacterized protein (TIGR03066 family)
MPAIRFVLSAALAVVLASPDLAEDKAPIKKELLVGVWVPAKLPEGLPSGSTFTVEFTMDGKIKTWVKFGDKEGPAHESLEGTYTIDGEKLTVVGKKDKENINRTVTISKLTEKELVAIGKDKDGKDETIEFIKKK